MKQGMLLAACLLCVAAAQPSVVRIVRNSGALEFTYAWPEFIASPDTVAPYAEGEYETALPVSAKMIAVLKPQYRASFEAQRQ